MGEAQAYIAEVLVRQGVVPIDRLPPLFETMRERGQSLADAIVASNIADEVRIAQALADECGVGFAPKIDIDAIPMALVSKIPITYAKQHRLLLTSEDDTTVHCVVADPFDTVALDDVRTLFGKVVEISVAGSEVVTNAINRVWEKKEDGGGTLQGDHTKEEDNLVDIIDSDDEAPIIAWVNGLFAQAVRERASDIHIEPEEREVIVRYRIDGELYVAKRASKQFMAPIVARVKIMASLNIAEKRLPQDGRITLKIAGRTWTFAYRPCQRAEGSSAS